MTSLWGAAWATRRWIVAAILINQAVYWTVLRMWRPTWPVLILVGPVLGGLLGLTFGCIGGKRVVRRL